jgi:hypothetical protein
MEKIKTAASHLQGAVVVAGAVMCAFMAGVIFAPIVAPIVMFVAFADVARDTRVWLRRRTRA